MSTVEWRPIPGYEGLYEVSADGQIRSLPRVSISRDGKRMRFPGKVLVPYVRKGYPHVKLARDGAVTSPTPVHRFVLAAFVGPLPEGMLTRHLDGDPFNNSVGNLAYGTPSENARDSVAHGTHWPASKTRCDSGHAFTPENTFWRKNGSRQCRQCRRESNRRHRASKRAA